MLHYYIKLNNDFTEVPICTFFGYVHSAIFHEKHSSSIVSASSYPDADYIYYFDSNDKIVAYMRFDNVLRSDD